MENKALICPTCSGQMKLAEAKPGDKIAKCEYCNTIVDLPDMAEKQGFDLNKFFSGFDMSKLNSNITNVTNITSTKTVVIKDGKVVSGDNADNNLDFVKEKLKKAGIHIEGLTDEKKDVDNSVDSPNTEIKE